MPTPPTLLSALHPTLAADAELTAAFGRPADGPDAAPGWFYRFPPPTDPDDGKREPYALFEWVGEFTAGESAPPGATPPWVSDGELRARVYADGPVQAEGLGETLSAVLEAQGPRYTRGGVASIRRMNPNGHAVRDPERGSRGQAVYRVLLRFRVRSGG